MARAEPVRVPLERLARLPHVCAGCGAASEGRRHDLVHRATDMTLLGKVFGLLGHGARWTTHRIPVPCCGRCAARAVVLPALWVAATASGFLLSMWAFSAGYAGPYDALGNLRTGLDLLGRAVPLGFLVCMFLGPPLTFVIQRRAAPARILALDEESVTFAPGSPALAEALALQS